MASVWYVDSNAAGTNAGTSWTNAWAKFSTGVGTVAAGDDVYVRNTHNETTASGVNLTWAGTEAAPIRIISTTNAHTPPVAGDITAGAKMSTTGASSITFNGSLYVYGVTLNCATGSTGANIVLANGTHFQTWENSTFILNNTGAATTVNCSGSQNGEVLLINPTFTFGGTGQGIIGLGRARIYNSAAILTGGSIPTALFRTPGASGYILVSGCDLSAITSGNALVGSNSTIIGGFLFQNCRLASGVTVANTPGTNAAFKVDLVNCDSGGTGYRQERYWYSGTLTTSTTVYNNATDGVTPISWQVVSTANCFRYAPFECFEIVQWAASGTYASSTIQITSATGSLTNADVWAEVQYLGSASYPLSTGITSAPATQLTAGSGLAAGTWSVGGAGNNYQIAIPSFTVNTPGYVRALVKVGKASLTAYVDPYIGGLSATRRQANAGGGPSGAVYVNEGSYLQYRNKMAGNLG